MADERSSSGASFPTFPGTSSADEKVLSLGEGPGKQLAGVGWIVALTIYQMAVIALLLYLLVRLWPHPTPSTEAPKETPGAAATAKAPPAPGAGGTCKQREAFARWELTEPGKRLPFDPECVTLFASFDVLIWNEQRLLLLILIAGALGGFVRGVRSLYWFVGNRSLVVSWVLMYFLLPIAGALISLFLYLLLRGGLFSPQASVAETSPFGFVSIAALAGMFSGSAAEKLKDMFEMLFKREAPGRDAAANPKPVLEDVTPKTTTAGKPVTITATGSSFMNDSKLAADGRKLPTTYVSETSLTAELGADVVANPATLKINVVTPEPGGGSSEKTVDFTVS